MVNPKQFFYQVDDAIIGPVTGIDLREAALAGSVVPATLVASDPSGQWVAANRVRGLFDESGKALPHPDEVKQSVANKEVVGIQPASTTPERGLSRSDDSSDEFRESAQPGDARNEPSAQDSARISPELWYAFLAGQIIGPLTVEQIRIMTRDGKLLPSDHVAVAGGQEWIQARHVEGLAFAATILTTGQPIPPPVQIEPRPSVECLGAPEIVPVVASHGSDIEASHVEQIRHTSALLSPNITTNVLPPSDMRRPEPSVVPPVQDFHPVSLAIRPRVRSAKLAEGQPVWVLLACTSLPWLAITSGPPLSGPEPLVMAIVSAILGWYILRRFCCADYKVRAATMKYALFSFVGTATAGIVLLLIFQKMAVHTAGTQGGHAILAILRVIGNAYNYTRQTPHDATGLGVFTNMLLSVGVCEEVVKLLPVFFLLRCSKAHDLPIRELMFVGAMSGLGFGVVEGVDYSYRFYIPDGDHLGMYVLRFGSIAIMHGVWTILAANILFYVRDAAKGGIGLGIYTVPFAFVALAAICLPSAICHSLYNTLQTFGLYLIAMTANGIAIFWLASLSVPTLLVTKSPTVMSESRTAGTRRQRAQPVWPWVLFGSVVTFFGLCGVGALFVEDAQPDSGVPRQPTWTNSRSGPQQIATINIICSDATPELVDLLQVNTLQRQAELSRVLTGFDVYGLRVRITNTGNIDVHIDPEYIRLHLGADVGAVSTLAHPSFLRAQTLHPGYYAEGLVYYRSTPDVATAIQLGGGGFSYVDPGVGVTYNP